MNTQTIENNISDSELEYIKDSLSQAVIGKPDSNISMKLLDRYYNKKNSIIDINEPLPNCGTFTPLAISCYFGATKEVEFLLKNDADANQSIDGVSIPLHLAITSGKLSVVKYLLKYGADINQKSTDGQTPLMRACESGQTEIVEYLIDNIDNLHFNVMEIDNNNKTCLDYALEKNHFKEIKVIEYYKLQKAIPIKTESGSRKTKL